MWLKKQNPVFARVVVDFYQSKRLNAIVRVFGEAHVRSAEDIKNQYLLRHDVLMKKSIPGQRWASNFFVGFVKRKLPFKIIEMST